MEAAADSVPVYSCCGLFFAVLASYHQCGDTQESAVLGAGAHVTDSLAGLNLWLVDLQV